MTFYIWSLGMYGIAYVYQMKAMWLELTFFAPTITKALHPTVPPLLRKPLMKRRRQMVLYFLLLATNMLSEIICQGLLFKKELTIYPVIVGEAMHYIVVVLIFILYRPSQVGFALASLSLFCLLIAWNISCQIEGFYQNYLNQRKQKHLSKILL